MAEPSPDRAWVDRFADVAEEAGIFMALFDPQDRLVLSNRAFREAYGIAPGDRSCWSDIIRRNHAAGRGTVVSADDFEAWLASARSRRGKLPFRAFEADLMDGRWIWMTETTDRSGWMLCVASDISSLRIEERELRRDRDIAVRASQTDALTGVANRRSMMSRLDLLVHHAMLDGIPGSLCILDIDGFKQINDLHGHQAGDAVLFDFTRRVEPFVRRRDGFGRIGGEEFMLLLPDTTAEEAEAMITDILSIVRAARPLPDDAGFSYTCSAGLSAFTSGDTSQTLFARADAALYTAKRAGRDRVERR